MHLIHDRPQNRVQAKKSYLQRENNASLQIYKSRHAQRPECMNERAIN